MSQTLSKPQCRACGKNKMTLWATSPDRLLSTHELFHYWKCHACGSLTLFPLPSTESLRDHYPTSYPPFLSHSKPTISKPPPVHTRMVSLPLPFLHALRNFFTGDLDWWWLPLDFKGRVLEIGSSNGAFLERLSRRCPYASVEGIEINDQAAAQARARGFNVHTGDLFHIQLTSTSYDLIYLSHVLEHLDDPQKYLMHLYSLLAPRGRIVILIPNSTSWSAYLFRSYWFALEAPRHFFIPSSRQLHTLLHDAGFRNITTRFRVYPKSFLKSIRYLMGKGQGNVAYKLVMCLTPFAKIASWAKATSVMEIVGEKNV